jgi:hypothetical protein
MDDTLCQNYFAQPSCPAQRQYEALRAVFLLGLPQTEAARQFGYSYDAFRQLVHQFRGACAAGTPPPFLTANAAAGRPPRRNPSAPTLPTSPTPRC